MKMWMSLVLIFSLSCSLRAERLNFGSAMTRTTAKDIENSNKAFIFGVLSLVGCAILYEQVYQTDRKMRAVNVISGPLVINPSTGVGYYPIDQGRVESKERFHSKNRAYRHALLGAGILTTALFTAAWSFRF